jgi:hypothetical protein
MTGAIRIASEYCLIYARPRQTRGESYIEHIVPGPSEPHFAKLFDIHMMCWGPGRERTEDEYARLLQAAGWTHFGSWYPHERTIGIVAGSAA